MLTIKAEAQPGENIENAFREAIELSKKLDCYIDVDFNGVSCSTSKLGSIKQGVERYHAALKESTAFKVAIA